MQFFKFGHSSKLTKLAVMLGLKRDEVVSADQPCGYTCRFAEKCKAFANPNTGLLIDGKNQKFRCYGASLEVAFPTLRRRNWHNFDVIRHAKTSGAMTDIILKSMSNRIKIVRIHSFGEFFSDNYFQAWVNVADAKRDISFFTYTKALDYMRIAHPENLSMTYSFGGLLDAQVKNESSAQVFDTLADAKKAGLPIACINHPADDYNFVKAGKKFALILHGTQPAGYYRQPI